MKSDFHGIKGTRARCAALVPTHAWWFVFLKFSFLKKKNREGDQRARSEDGERQAEEGEEAPDHLLQLPAGRPAAAVPEHAVPGAAGESRAGRVARSHANTGGIIFLKHPLMDIFIRFTCFKHEE